MDKRSMRIRRAMRTRYKLKELGAIRLVIHRTPRHIYAQIITSDGSKVITSASTIEKVISKQLKYTGNMDAAVAVGSVIAERSLKIGIRNVSFDRSGFKYHGRIQALANAARKVGLQF